ncbi:hypothetical protein LWI29_017011 [Acer saccharum]|uniref:CCHC-type domain-containing protein n=1 Tax=Acer saccharum TaxID=4024 RepID=A0AA39RRR4_ACESA|nr:hypothetical protein LWI29_017011 [Acer saccharum]
MLLCDDGHVPEVYVSVVEKVSVEPGYVGVCTDQPVYQNFLQQLAAQFQSTDGSNNVVGSIPTTNHAVETLSVNPIIYEDPTINEVMPGRYNEDERLINPHTDYGLDDFDEDYNGDGGSREGVNDDPAHYDGMDSDPSEGGRSGSMPPVFGGPNRDTCEDDAINVGDGSGTAVSQPWIIHGVSNYSFEVVRIEESSSFCKKKFVDFCSDFYKTSTWLESYFGVIFPVGHPNKWNTPKEVRSEVVLPPEWRPQANRPRKKNVSSAGEHGRRTNKQNCPNPPADHQPNVVDPQPDPQPNVADQQPDPQPRRHRKCNTCGQEGHNIKTCPTWPYDNPTNSNIDVE